MPTLAVDQSRGKTCSCCGVFFPDAWEGFYVHKGKPHGTRCKKCKSAAVAACTKERILKGGIGLYLYNKDPEFRERVKKKACARARAMLATEEGRAYLQAQKRQWRARHPDKWLEQNRRNKERRRAAGLILKARRLRILAYYGEHCARCGTTDDLTIDHIIPIFRGGGSEFANLQVLCMACNSSKGTQIIDYRKIVC